MHKWLKFGDLEVKAKTRFTFTTPVPKCRRVKAVKEKKQRLRVVYTRARENGEIICSIHNL